MGGFTETPLFVNMLRPESHPAGGQKTNAADSRARLRTAVALAARTKTYCSASSAPRHSGVSCKAETTSRCRVHRERTIVEHPSAVSNPVAVKGTTSWSPCANVDSARVLRTSGRTPEPRMQSRSCRGRFQHLVRTPRQNATQNVATSGGWAESQSAEQSAVGEAVVPNAKAGRLRMCSGRLRRGAWQTIRCG